MNQVLSQSEVDALLNAVAEGSLDTSNNSGTLKKDAKAAEVNAYDLTNQDRVMPITKQKHLKRAY